MKTGYVYDPIFLKHNLIGHPENAERLHVIQQSLKKANVWSEMHHVPSRKATEDELAYVHTKNHIKYIKDINTHYGGYVDADTYVNEHSFEAACVAAGSVIDLALATIQGNISNGFAFVRPPGHHATRSRAMGFCLFSNVAVAAKAAQKQAGLERVAIVDFDAHHGNGTQDIVITDSSVFFCSSHQYPFYPGTGHGSEIGQCEAKGTTMNFPLSALAGDEWMKRLYIEILTPALHRYKPELILVSAGYDAHWNDPLTNLGFSLTLFGWLSQTLIKLAQELCQGRIIFVLEGGYHPQAIGQGITNTVKALLGRDDFDDSLGSSTWQEPDMGSYIDDLKKLHAL